LGKDVALVDVDAVDKGDADGIGTGWHRQAGD
jgi:hypothetical protein